MHPTRAYVLFTALWGAGMGATATIYSPNLLSHGMSFSDIAAINLLFWLAVSIAEVPTGLFADGRGRAWSIRAGAILHVIGAFGYVFATTFWQAATCEMIIGLGIAFLSGAQQAWLVDALARRGESEKVGRVFGTAAAVRAVAAIAGGTAGALIGSVHLNYGWALSAGLHLAATVFAFTSMNGDGDSLKKLTEREAFAASYSATRRIPGLGWALGMSVAFGFVLPFNHFWSPFFLEKVGQSGLGLIWIPLFLAIMAGGLAVRRGGLLLGSDYRGVVVSLFVTGIGLALAGLTSGLALPLMAVLVHEFGRGMFEPLMDTYTHKRIESGYRATYASFQSLVQRAGFAAILGAVVLLTRHMPSNGATVSSAWIVSGGLLVVCALVATLIRPAKTD